jgi:hypothetical protein
MEDTARHGAPQPEEVRHTLTVRDVEALLAQAGVQRSHRHVLRMCQTGMLDAVKFPGGPSGDQWHVTPASVPKAIGDLKQIDEQRARRSAPRRAMSDSVAVEQELEPHTAVASHAAPQPATSVAQNQDDASPTQPAVARHGAIEHDIYEHPYVKRLEAQVEKLEKKYDDQVRRTEDIQLKSQQQIIELQRMTAIGQSQTLADFMLRAKEYFLGSAGEPEKRELGDHPTT